MAAWKKDRVWHDKPCNAFVHKALWYSYWYWCDSGWTNEPNAQCNTHMHAHKHNSEALTAIETAGDLNRIQKTFRAFPVTCASFKGSYCNPTLAARACQPRSRSLFIFPGHNLQPSLPKRPILQSPLIFPLWKTHETRLGTSMIVCLCEWPLNPGWLGGLVYDLPP